MSDKCDEPASEEVEMTIESTVETEISLNVVEEEEEEEKGAKEGEDVGEEEGEGGGEFEQELKDDTRSRHQPMDLGSPLDSDPDFDLSGDMLDLESHELDGGGGGGDKGEKDAQDGGSKSQERDSLLLGGRLDRLDSNLDLSYQPASDVLLYEGDPENEEQEGEGKDAGEGRMSTAAGDFGGEIGVVKNQEKEEDEEFMLEVHYKGSGSGGGGLDENIAVATTAEADGKRGRATRLATDSDRFVSLSLSLFLLSLSLSPPLPPPSPVSLSPQLAHSVPFASSSDRVDKLVAIATDVCCISSINYSPIPLHFWLLSWKW